MTFDIVILSYSKSDQHRKITEDCVRSLKKAKNKIRVNIIVLESFTPDVKFKGTTTIFYQQPKFNYNNSMNTGFAYCKNRYIFFCNNDLIFHDGWADNCYYAFAMGFESVSPYCPVSHPRFVEPGGYVVTGYQVGFHIAGWCIGVNRDMFVRIGGFNEAVSFWYSDNLYAEQLKYHGITHALVCGATVKHLDYGSMTLKTMTAQQKAQLTSAQRKKYLKEVRRIWDAKKEKVLH